MKLFKILLALCLLLTFSSCFKNCKSSSDAEKKSARVFFSNVKNNDKVVSPVNLTFEIVGKKLRPAGENLTQKTSGHHHILIDNNMGYIEEGMVVPMDEKHLHFGKAQTKASIKLSPGRHKLSLQFADGAHISYGKALSNTIWVEVAKSSP
ncbi:DUF4399 domain-containing protein [Sulfobacillus acidophilus]|uniref:DUF4399 domain-containing protein n=1 Tax=Sulfobacillus acidophilus TaxID=53633 RepID=A0ABS3AWG8_9FIRM|nr:DUF4399 domain-containing protein [Sulfobacillus acidophilus]